jgi:TRAP transporter TAXI family solute receptor
MMDGFGCSVYPNTSRRRLLSMIGATSAIGVTGCLGSDADHTVNISTPPSGTSTNQAMQALQRAIQQESDLVDFTVEEVSGDPASVRQFNDGGSDGYAGGIDIIYRAIDDREPFDESPAEEVAPQVFSMTQIHHYWIAVEGSGIETFDDIAESDLDLYALPPGFGLRRLLEDVHENAGVWEDIEPRVVNLETDEVASAIDEGRIDAGVVYGASFVNVPGWVAEIDGQADVYAVEDTGILSDGIESTDGANVLEEEPYGWSQDMGSDLATMWGVPFYLYLGEDVSDEAVYEIVRVSHEHNDTVQEADEAYLDHTDVDQMVDELDDTLPLHPGAEEFYNEAGADL